MLKFFVKISIIAIICGSAFSADAAVISKSPNNLGLTAYWSFNEGTGATTTDFSGNNHYGTTTGASAATWVDGKRGKALNFDGVNDYVDIADSSSFQFTGAITVSAWVKFDTLANNARIVAKEGDGTHRSWSLNLETGPDPDTIAFRIASNGSTSTHTETSGAADGPVTNQWLHIVGVYTPSTSVEIYRNGVRVANNTTSIPASQFTNNGLDVNIGRRPDSVTGTDGIIDDVRIYSRALSAAEVATLYRSGAARTIAPDNLGLVGYWSFNEGTGATTTDFSGNGNRGVLTNMDTVGDWVSGKQGKALDFDGTNDGVDAASPTSLDDLAAFTYSAWIYPRSLAADEFAVIAKGRGAAGVKQILVGDWFGNSDNLVGFIDATTDGASVSANGTITTNTWQFVTLTWAGTGNVIKLYKNGAEVTYGSQTAPVTVASDAATNLVIGARDNVSPTFNIPFNGLIDEARVYNRALSAAEVATLYSLGSTRVNAPDNKGLVGYWSFDEGEGATTTDFSGTGNVGTTTGATWVAGKQGKALNFDGVDDIVGVSDAPSLGITGAMTISAWVQWQSTTQLGTVVSRNNGAGARGYSLRLNGGGSGDKAEFHISSDCTLEELVLSTNVVPLNEWVHWVGVYEPSVALRIYKNGVLDNSNTVSIPASQCDNNRNLGIGKRVSNAHPLDGIIDEVRVYNRVLSAAEIVALYNMGR